MTLTLERVDPFHVGALFMLLEMATAYAGQLYGVNAFDQPGVELGKQFTYAMLGRADADAGAPGMGSAAQAGSEADRLSGASRTRRAGLRPLPRAERASPVLHIEFRSLVAAIGAVAHL